MNEARGKKAWELNEEIKNNEEQRRVLLARNAVLLSEILDKKYYKELLGFEDAEWSGYLADLDIYYTRNQINTYVRIHNKLTRELKIDPEDWIRIPVTRLGECLPFITRENYEEWFSKASMCISSDWRIELDRAKGKEIEDDHKHDMVNYEICRICGEKHKL